MNTARAIDYLERDRLRNIIPLMFLQDYGDRVDVAVAEEHGRSGVLLRMATDMFRWDKLNYGSFDQVLIPVVDSPDLLPMLLADIPAGPTVFKLQSDTDLLHLRARYVLTRERAIVDYTQSSGNQPHPVVQVCETLDERLVELFGANTYARDELVQKFHHGAASFAVFVEGEPVSVGMAFRNYKDVWEIGGVRTVESSLRQGLAVKVVDTALAYLHERNLKPRYVLLDTNQASAQLAIKCGLQQRSTFTHYSTCL